MTESTADRLFVLGFEEQDTGVFTRKYVKHDGRTTYDFVTLDNEGNVLSGQVPVYQTITRRFGQ
jgi:hypothetical protein